MTQVIKRDGRIVNFDKSKIILAIEKAMVCTKQGVDSSLAASIADKISNCHEDKCTIAEIQTMVEDLLMDSNRKDVARAYIEYRSKRDRIRSAKGAYDIILGVIEGTNEDVNTENSNKNSQIASTQRDYMAGATSKFLTNEILLPDDIVKAHNEGIIHFHDADYFAMHVHNCDLVNLEDMLQNGTVISGTLIEKPHSFSTACNIATQIIAQVASSQYGGQSETLSHLAPFVDISRQKYRKEVHNSFYEMLQLNEISTMPDEDTINRIAEERLKDEVKKGVQTIQYQINTLMTTNGQTPFVTIFMYLDEVPEGQTRDDLAMIIEEVLKQRYQGVKNEAGAWITPAFPKLIYVLDEDDIYPDSPYYYLTTLAAKCTAKRLVPDYISAKKMKEYKLSKGEKEGEGDVYPSMGCRSFLTPDRSGNGFNNVANAKNYDGKPKYYGRFNQGVVTINLPDVALSSGGNFEKFWKIFDERLELCHRALQLRHKRLMGTSSDIAPILWQYGALARLKKGEPIDRLLYGGYSSISLGYAGLCECVRYMTGIEAVRIKGHISRRVLTSIEVEDEADARENADTELGNSIPQITALTNDEIDQAIAEAEAEMQQASLQAMEAESGD